MRPYLAIIKDSFREALSSRVLWILMGLITLELLCLAAVGIRTDVRTDFNRGDIVQGPRLAATLRLAAVADESSPGKRMWSFIGEENQKQLTAFTQMQRGDRGDYFRGVEVLYASLTQLIHRRDLYDEQAWKSVTLPKEAKDLLDKRGTLKDRELARLNRVLIEAAFPAHFRHGPAEAIVITLVGMDTGVPPLPFTREQVIGFIKEWVLSILINYVSGSIGLIAGLLVTSAIVPQMFEPGSITLLLSKPVSRSLLFFSKFVSGCAFMLINMSYLIVGLWLIAGWRYDIWNHRMLWCIPMFLFIFLIYYSVSSLAGIIWKSPVVSVVVTIGFYLSCQFVGTVKEWIDAFVLNPVRIVKVAEADGTLFGVSERGNVAIWERDQSEWQSVHDPGDRPGAPTIDGPYYHAATRQILVGQGFVNPFGFAGRRITLRLGSAETGWNLANGPSLPGGTSTFLVEHDGHVLAVAEDDIFRLRGDPEPAAQEIKIFGVPLPLSTGTFRPVLADSNLNFDDPLTAAADPQSSKLAVCSSKNVYLFRRQEEDQKFVQIGHRELAGERREGSAVAVAGKFVVVAREDGPVWLLSSDDLSVVKSQTLEPYTQPRFAAASPDGKQIGVLFQNRRLWLIDAQTGDARPAAVSGQGDISGFAFTKDRLLIATHVNRVIAYDAKTLAFQERFSPELTRFDIVYDYVILPFYTLFPKPGELDNTVHYILTGKRTTDGGVFRGQVAQAREDLHPWRPVKNGLAFIAIVLLIACIYIERHEF